MPTLCLCMIVKDEAHVIRRCLASVKPVVDAWVVVDTGSTDGTQDIVRNAMAGLPGELIERPWVDFAHNRNQALDLARGRADYVLVIDADDAFEVPAGFRLPTLDLDSYTIDIRDNGVAYQRTQIFCNALPWRYVGVLHEYLECREAKSTGHLPLVMRRNHEGARSRDPDTYRKDAAVLEHALLTETDSLLVSRYTFYLAQSYRDCNEREKAVRRYLERATLGHWNQEVFVALYQAGKLMEALGRPPDEVLRTYERATVACPDRAEAAHAASRLCRVIGRNREGYDVAVPARTLVPPPAGLFVETWIYRYGLLDELAINAYWAGLHAECRDSCLEVLARNDVPVSDRARVVANLRFSLDRLAEAAGSATTDGVVWQADLKMPPSPMPLPALAKSRGGTGSVSIITPTRDRARFLRRTARYMQAQTHTDVEWLILDDSPQRPVLSEEFTGANITYEHSPDPLSVGEKRNRLIEKAKGDVIVQFDDDDYYAPEYVSIMLSALADRDADIINLRAWYLYDMRSRFFGYWDLMVKTGPHYRCDGNGVALKVFTERDTADFTDNEFGYGFSYVFKRNVWAHIRYPDVDWNEDGRFVIAARERFVVDGFPDTSGLCLHMLHPASSSRCFPQWRLPDFLLRTLFPIMV